MNIRKERQRKYAETMAEHMREVLDDPTRSHHVKTGELATILREEHGDMTKRQATRIAGEVMTRWELGDRWGGKTSRTYTINEDAVRSDELE